MDLFSEDIRISDLENAVKLFKESRDGFVKLFNNSPVCMSMTTTNLGRREYVRVNKKFIEKFGWTVDEIVGKNSIELGILDQAESERVRAIITEKGRLQNDYVKCFTKTGEVVHTVSSIEAMEMNGETHLVSFFVDVTKIVEQQAIIEKHSQQLEELNKELEAFSYSVSHDLRAPLRAITGFISILAEDHGSNLNEEAKRLLTSVQRNATRMNTLIDDLLEFARLGRKSIERALLDMNALVAEVLEEQKSNAKITVDNLHPIRGDYALIKQVLVNLISNAIKYSSKKENPEVNITSRIENDMVVFSVKDNGAGFDMQFASKLFGVFQRLHKATEFEGTGVGLATVQRIIAKHGGSIHAEAEVDKGATFYFKIPVAENR
ncbi:MAG TPA: ATP-binding protein [Cyclobacteriaceae bacterium]|nr:ATP-binding protein [Cyclobacteriaceae bacterium]